MSNITKRNSLSELMADKAGLSRDTFLETVKSICMPEKHEATTEELVAFLMVANKLDLNPFTKEIYAIKNKFGKISYVVSVDGWLHMINRNPAFNGMSFDFQRDGAQLISVTCKMHRKDRDHAVEVTEFLSECEVPPHRDKYTGQEKPGPWQQYPARMLRHRAMIQAARYAFSFAGIIDDEEACDRYIVAEEIISPDSLDEEQVECIKKYVEKYPDAVSYCLTRCNVERIEDIPSRMYNSVLEYLDGESKAGELTPKDDTCSTNSASSATSGQTPH